MTRNESETIMSTRSSITADLLLRLCHRMAGNVDPLPPRPADW